MKLAVTLLITVVLCSSLGAGSAHEVVPGFLQTLLEGSLEQLYAGPISQYKIDDLTKAALTALKKCIDELSPEHVKALVNLLVINSRYYYETNDYNCAALCQILDKEHPDTFTEASLGLSVGGGRGEEELSPSSSASDSLNSLKQAFGPIYENRESRCRGSTYWHNTSKHFAKSLGKSRPLRRKR